MKALATATIRAGSWRRAPGQIVTNISLPWPLPGKMTAGHLVVSQIVVLAQVFGGMIPNQRGESACLNRATGVACSCSAFAA